MPIRTPSQVGRAMSWPRRDQGHQTLRQILFVCPSSVHHYGENMRLWISPYPILRKYERNARSHAKIQGRRKTQSHLPWCFHSTKKKRINLTKAGAAERGDFLISFEPHLLGVHSFLFFPTLPSSETKFYGLLFLPLGFCKFNCFEKTGHCLNGLVLCTICS